jgi:hypothetical protein
MFFDDHKKSITTMMKKRSSKGDLVSGPTPLKPEVVRDEEGDLSGKHIAAQDIIAAHHEGSADKLNQALSNFIDLHKLGPSEAAPVPDKFGKPTE